MTKNKKIIFILTFIFVVVILVGIIMYFNRGVVDEGSPWYKKFNPFNTTTTETNQNETDNNSNNEGVLENGEGGEQQTSRFYQITDFAVSGATYYEEKKPIINSTDDNTPKVEQITTPISIETKEGRQEIQRKLNELLSLNPPLTTDGNFGKLTTKAIELFQKNNGLTVTGKIDQNTSHFFTKTTTSVAPKEEIKYEIIPAVRYVKRTNGHIYQTNLENKNSNEISNTTIPTIYEAYFDGTTNSVLYRYLEKDNSVTSFLGTLGASKGEFLPQNILGVSLSPDKNKFFYITKYSDKVSGTEKSFLDGKTSDVFSSSYTEWLPQWISDQKIFLTTKPHSTVAGALFSLNTSNKTLTKILGGVSGLTTLSNSYGSFVLYNETTNRGPLLNIFDNQNHISKSLDIYGLPEKCVWSDASNIYCAIPNTISGTQYPESWYQGLVSFDDQFVKINASTGEVVLLINSINETPVDATNLFLDNSNSTIFFINKKDYTLWSLDIR